MFHYVFHFVLSIFAPCAGLHVRRQFPFGGCTRTAWDQAVSAGAAQRWAEMSDNPCVFDDVLDDFKNGYENSTDFMDAVVPSNALNRFADAETQHCSTHLLPKVMYMGLPHAGSTLLTSLLDMHPEISYGVRKEHRFFTGSAHYIINNRRYTKMRSLVTFARYRHEFTVPCGTKVTFDGDPDVVFMGNSKLPRDGFRSTPGPAAIEELRTVLGNDVRFILVIRDPVDVINSLSHDLGDDGGGVITEDPNDRVLQDMMCLADSVAAWLASFPREQFLFLDANVVFANVTSAVDRMLEFANVSPRQYSVNPNAVPSGRRRASPVKSELRKKYHTDPHNIECKRRLETLTGLTFQWGI